MWRAADPDRMTDAHEQHPASLPRCDFSLQDLEVMWSNASARQHECYRADGLPAWSKVRGPISATMLSLDRIGWHWITEKQWTDDLGVTHDIADLSPWLMNSMLKHSVTRLAERTLAAKIGHPSLTDGRACVDLVRNYARKKQNQGRSRQVVEAAATNMLWSKTRLRDAGYDIENVMCDLCNAEEDTVHHRAWRCQHGPVKAARCKAATAEVIALAIQEGEGSCVFQHGIIRHPADYLPGVGAQVTKLVEHSPTAQITPDSAFTMTGHVFADGHCSRTGIRGLDRATWALVEVDDAGNAIRSASGTVPPTHLQTPQAGEFFAALYALQLCNGLTVLYDDCSNVVRTFMKDKLQWGAEKSAYGGLMRAARKWKTEESWDQVIKVKAHQTLSRETMSDVEYYRGTGNDRADKAAKAAACFHAQAEAAAMERYEKERAHAEAAIRVFAAVLPMWPFLEKQKRTKQSAEQVKVVQQSARVPTEKRHKWVRGTNAWHCQICRTHCRAAVIPKHRIMQTCGGLADRIAAIADEGLGHRITEFSSQTGPFSICSDCGRWSVRRIVGLATACTHKLRTPYAARAWKRVFLKGRHPGTGTPMRAVDGQRNSNGRDDGVIPSPTLKSQNMRQRRNSRLTGKGTPWARTASAGVKGEPPAPTTEQDPALAGPGCHSVQPMFDQEWNADVQAQDKELQDFFSFDDCHGDDSGKGTACGHASTHGSNASSLLSSSALGQGDAYGGKSSRGADGAAVGESRKPTSGEDTSNPPDMQTQQALRPGRNHMATDELRVYCGGAAAREASYSDEGTTALVDYDEHVTSNTTGDEPPQSHRCRLTYAEIACNERRRLDKSMSAYCAPEEPPGQRGTISRAQGHLRIALIQCHCLP
jgi:hypothetical protein